MEKLEYTQVKKKNKVNYFKLFFINSFFITIGLLFLIGLSGMVWFKVNIIDDLPPVSKIKDMDIKKTTDLYSRDNVKLYSFYDEKRTVVKYNDISPNMVKAIVSIEDKRFWSNQGFDVSGILRAVKRKVRYKIGLSEKINHEGASTITQQLIKNMLLTNEKTIKRKLKELVLSHQLTEYLKYEIEQENNKSSGKMTKEEMNLALKEDIMAMYLNFVFFGENSYGIQSASQTFFHKDAKDLTVMESAVLASMPKAPSALNPFINKNKSVGSSDVLEFDGAKYIQGKMNADLKSAIEKEIRKNPISYIFELYDTEEKKEFKGEKNTYKFLYIQGRKDFVLKNMYQQGKITDDEMKQAFLDGLDASFTRSNEEIRAPHFVWYVRDYITNHAEVFEKIGVNQKTLSLGGYKIISTLNYNIQEKSEKIIAGQRADMLRQGANNVAFSYTDPRNGDILAYVGSHNYHDKSIQGQNDMLRAMRQPGSSIKPFVYAKMFVENPYTIDQPMLDAPVNYGGWKPKNSDGRYKGVLPVKNMLAYSRNTTAIKAFFSGGGEQKNIDFMYNMGIESIKKNKNYGASLSLGAGEVRGLDLVQGYNTLANGGRRVDLNPIEKIINDKGEVIYDKNNDIKVSEADQVVSNGVAYMIYSILSNKKNIPWSWNSLFPYRGVTLAQKTGTSNKGRYPNNGLLVSYTPERNLFLWGGNTDGSVMKGTTYGSTLHRYTLLKLGNMLQKEGDLKEVIMNRPQDTVDYTISKLNGDLATKETPSAFRVKTIGHSGQPLTKRDSTKEINYDKHCNGMISENTMEDNKSKGILVSVAGTTKKDYNGVLGFWRKYFQNNEKFNGLFLEEPKEKCEFLPHEEPAINIIPEKPIYVNGNVDISFTHISPKDIREISILGNGKVLHTFTDLKKNGTKATSVKRSQGMVYSIKIEDVDYGYKTLVLGTTEKPDTETPKLVSITDTVNGISFSFSDNRGLASITITNNGVNQEYTTPNTTSYSMEYTLANGTITYTVIDKAGNVLNGSYTKEVVTNETGGVLSGINTGTGGTGG